MSADSENRPLLSENSSSSAETFQKSPIDSNTMQPALEKSGSDGPKPRTTSIDKQVSIFSWTYDIVVWIFLKIFELFFREVRSRGAFRIPKEGPVIFVAAPHANQFIDPMLVMQQVKIEAGRRVSFLVAAKSLKRKFIGLIARLTLSIGVVRAQDNLKSATGKIFIDFDKNPLLVRGEGTKFTKELAVKGLLGLPNSLGNAEIEEIISDTELLLRKEYKNSKGRDLVSKGTSFKYAPHVDQSSVYQYVFEHLHKGGCLGIFPEGGSHDRSDLLPLKAGVAIMALGAIAAHPDCNVKIVAVGMNYFHPNKFRSRAVLEFGHPMDIPNNLVEDYRAGGDRKREAVKAVLDSVTDGLRAVTVRCPDWDTLMVVQTARRLYRPSGRKVPLSLVIELNRRLLEGYNHFKDDPSIIASRKDILAYNRDLKDIGLQDHQVETASINKLTLVGKLIFRVLKLVFLAPLALPGTVMFAPVFIATRVISKQKAAEALKASTVKLQANDVVATWKVLVAMGFAPLLYTFYAVVATYIEYKYQLFPSKPFWLVAAGTYVFLALVTYAALLIGETGLDIFKSLRPLALALSPRYTHALSKLQQQRQNLVLQVTDTVNTFGPKLYPDFRDLSKETEDENSENFSYRSRKEKTRPRSLSNASGTSETSDSSHALSRVNSETSIGNIPFFGTSDGSSSTEVSKFGSGESSRTESEAGDYAHSSATDRRIFQTEVSNRIRDVMQEEARKRTN